MGSSIRARELGEVIASLKRRTRTEFLFVTALVLCGWCIVAAASQVNGDPGLFRQQLLL